jgi:predicted metal-dependent hydrolase
MLSEEITVRNLSLEWQEASSRLWFGNSPFLSNCLNAFSTTFPAGERFFVESVRHFRDGLEDPELKARTVKFIGQESAHGREHRRFNDLLRAEGYPAGRAEAWVEKMFAGVRRRYSPQFQLAVTCAIEHFTTILSTQMLRSPEVHRSMSGEHARLWCWHWVEELEHKSVAFDVHRAIGGTHWNRVVAMIGTSLMMWPLIACILFMYQAHDHRLFAPRDWWTALTWGWLRPGLLRRAVPAYFAYFRPGYHPSQNDDKDLVALGRVRLTT